MTTLAESLHQALQGLTNLGVLAGTYAGARFRLAIKDNAVTVVREGGVWCRSDEPFPPEDADALAAEWIYSGRALDALIERKAREEPFFGELVHSGASDEELKAAVRKETAGYERHLVFEEFSDDCPLWTLNLTSEGQLYLSQAGGGVFCPADTREIHANAVAAVAERYSCTPTREFAARYGRELLAVENSMLKELAEAWIENKAVPELKKMLARIEKG